MGAGSTAHVEQARLPSETTQASRKIVPGRKRKGSRPVHIWGCVIAAAALSGCNAAPLDSAAEDRSDGADPARAAGSLGNPGVVPPQAHPGGMSLAEWSAVWWQQILAIPFDRNPLFDGLEPDIHGGSEHCEEGAHGHVWFLAGTAGGSATRTCTIPTGTRILFPLLATADDNNRCPDNPLDCSRFPTLEACLTENAHTLLPPDPTLFAVVDGVPLHNLLDYVQTSRLFFFTGDPTLIDTLDSCITGSRQEAVSYGWWIMLQPLPPGDHTLHFGGSAPGISVDVTYQLHIRH